jgi:hypothetical protein
MSLKPVSSGNLGSESPGPGNYNHVSEERVLKASPKFKIPKSNRGDSYKADPVPGPGNYNTIGSDEGPKWKFGS